jgi:hypothetical protein
VTIIREIGNDVVGADDNAYEWETAKYNGMLVADATNNADSFAHFSWDASNRRPRRPPRRRAACESQCAEFAVAYARERETCDG